MTVCDWDGSLASNPTGNIAWADITFAYSNLVFTFGVCNSLERCLGGNNNEYLSEGSSLGAGGGRGGGGGCGGGKASFDRKSSGSGGGTDKLGTMGKTGEDARNSGGLVCGTKSCCGWQALGTSLTDVELTASWELPAKDVNKDN